MPTDALLFIDANQYLQLYGLVAGKKLLDFPEEQRAHIFVTTQVVDEVIRNKLSCALIFMLDKFKELTRLRLRPTSLATIDDDHSG